MAADTIPHHPNFIRWIKHPGEQAVTFEWRPFTGSEPEPEDPPYATVAHLDPEVRALVYHEYETLRRQWALTRWRNDLKSLLAAAAPVWPALASARTTMTDTYEALRTTTDGWHAAVLRLVEAQDAALAAARRWDDVAGPIAAHIDALYNIDSRYINDAAELRAVAGAQGITGTDEWAVEAGYTYEPSYARTDTPMVALVREEVDRQRATLRQVDELTAVDPAPAR